MGIRLRWTFGVYLQMKTGASIGVLTPTTHMLSALSPHKHMVQIVLMCLLPCVCVCMIRRRRLCHGASHLVSEIIRLLFGWSTGMKRGHYSSQGSSLTATTDPNNTSSSFCPRRCADAPIRCIKARFRWSLETWARENSQIKRILSCEGNMNWTLSLNITSSWFETVGLTSN